MRTTLTALTSPLLTPSCDRTQDAGERVFRVASKVPVMDYMTAAPCGVCPVFDECTEGGVISPATCPYLSKWLSY